MDKYKNYSACLNPNQFLTKNCEACNHYEKCVYHSKGDYKKVNKLRG